MTARPISETVASLMPRARAELAELVAFQSVADPAVFPKSECEAAANWVADALRAEDFTDVALLDTPDGTQSVYGFLPGPAGAPTVLLYAHYDVQPPLDESAWLSPPFELTDRDGRWYGRGAADCKGGFIMHLLALRALKANGGVPVSVKVIAEGSEEQGTGGLERYAEAHPELLAADTIVIGDAGNFRAGLPTVTATLRGMTMLRVQLDTLEGNLHSGQFGGAAPDALAAMIQLLASLRDEHGTTTVDGLTGDTDWDGLQYPEAEFRQDAKVLDGVELIGTGTVADRIWARPAVTVVGIDCPPVVGATPSVQASARAQVSLRVPPGHDAAEATKLLTAHLESHAPWGARVSVEQVGQGQPFRADTSSPAYTAMAGAMRDAYPGQEMQSSGMGGSIPLCNTLASLYPQAEILLIGLSEPEAQIHAVNESVSPEELERMSVAEALFLHNYAESKKV
ncbi:MULTISPECIES: dipeptidase [Streptomyces]|uniref:Dipeptidase n=2 Tax=Streptomyces microflavus TaxID=1919 RepID=A0A7J0CIH8_STRMI|nr:MULTISPECIES: dipeptidase [Streptomyces]MBK3585008.1 dipeptidase [Streptomyces sp. MBT57]AGK75584.1 Peptidase M20 [Streptomyces microflavus DSM 40593]MBW3357094.1 dipeptidase [Streptomyces sp. 09ZI22]MDX2401671.1 dipeptidase [Streptomyces microflavus]MDX2977790.1 dipeptidase [Streptomyces sp. NRRL_B-2249]